MDSLYDDFFYEEAVEDGAAAFAGAGAAAAAAESMGAASASPSTVCAMERVIVLERNISCLYTTARLEVQRKDAALARAREALEAERAARALQASALRVWMGWLRAATGKLTVALADAPLPPPPSAAAAAA